MTTVSEFYGRWAGLYDWIATAPGVGRWRRRAARRAAEAGETVVEMGCGSGANLPYLREQVGPEGRVVGVDITGPLLERARRRVVDYDNATVVRGDARRPPVAADAVDSVVATFVCGMFERPATVLEEWCELVGAGGRVAVMDATASGSGPGRALNPLFSAFTAASAPGTGVREVCFAPLVGYDDALSERVRSAHEALASRTRQRRYETFALGFVELLSGRVE
jgi:ubiquinone/menaquinone biosynthesis C-methylase UbiE